MTTNVSIGVFSKLTDLSGYVSAVPGTVGFIAFISEKGLDNEVVATTSRDFFVDFGRPDIRYAGNTYGFGPYVASRFLGQSDSLFVMRCLPDDATFSNLALHVDSTTGVVTSSSLTGINSTGEFDTSFTGDTTLAVVFRGEGRGDFYNKYKVVISAHSNSIKATDGVFLLEFQIKQEALDPETETVQYNLYAGPFEVSFDPDMYDEDGDSMYVESVVNRYVKDIKCIADDDLCKSVKSLSSNWDAPFGTSGIVLTNGTTGTLFDPATGRVDPIVADPMLAGAYAGTLTKQDGVTISREMIDPDLYPISVVFDAGYPKNVKDKVAQLAIDRDDCIAVVDNGDNFTVTESVSSRTTDHTYSSKNVFIGDIYSKVFDLFTGKDIWVPPSFHVAKLIPYTDNLANVHTSIAGPNRGVLPEIKEVRYSPLLAERDTLYLNQLNPVIFLNIGPMLWDQLTSQKRPSKLQQLHISRLYLYIKRALENFSKYYVHEKMDASEFENISKNINDFLTEVKNERGLYGFSVSVGANDYDKKKGNVKVDVTLDPTQIIRQIHLNFFIK